MVKKIAFVIFLVVYLTAPPTFGSFMEPTEGPVLVAGPDQVSISDYRDMIDYTKKHGHQEPCGGGGIRYSITFGGPNYVMPGHQHGLNTVVEFSYMTGEYSGVNIHVFGRRLVKYTEVPTYIYGHLYMDDADVDMKPNSIVQVNVRTEDGIITLEEYKSISTMFGGWDYFLNLVYKEYKSEGM